ncbi:MJ0042-type zinc finger domain-containing protein [Zavarzinella formosa]|uniref:MJ0042-type zinc finger domain-containing protein n=1 Tax=Zavarzinella formosa TaxID=360055 RepID=UPI0002D8CDF6|nr:MJ0042-type zinc finger domain-containing protein [Zavarzinella formosa]
MPITLNCPKCHKPFRVRDESIGGRVRCPSCAAILQVPSSLSPASSFGYDMPGGLPPNPAEGGTGATRPMAEDLLPTPPPSDDDLLLGGPARPPAMEYGSAGMALPAPPSIKFRGAPSVPGTNPVPSSPLLPTAPSPYSVGGSLNPPSSPLTPAGGKSAVNLPKAQSSLILPPAPGSPAQANAAAAANEWAATCSGLSMIQAGLILWMIPFLGGIAHGVWAYMKPDQAMSNAPGYLGRPELPFWKEIMLAYTALPISLGLVLLFFGRAKCTSIPEQSTARGLARGATFCTLLGVIGAASAAAFYMGYTTRFNLPPITGPLGLCVWLPAAVLADLFTLFFIAQAGWAAGMPRLLLSVGTFLTFVLVAPAMMVAATLFCPVIEPLRTTLSQYGSPFAGPDKQATMRILIAGAIVMTYGVMLFGRYASLVAAAKRAIRNQFGQG